ncbi:RteC domain-containing protein [Chitinophaga varians]|uniref:RteC domain-containing protein n=1 Tax=Chitinophaga varians TaxID=2202339 RepID=UPI00165FEB56|nr:RteC domain-containing protein [Chitinophaga varians]MBC9909113.1 RteC domain-containing protein [Chitinophaga varians]
MLAVSIGLLQELQGKINIFLRNPSANVIGRSEKIIHLINSDLERLKELIRSHAFNDAADEIKFYKEVMPQFYALWIYHTTVYNIQCHTAPNSRKHQLKYFDFELRRIDDFFFHHLEFYKYYRSGRTYLDVQYFTRHKNDEPEFVTDLYAGILDKDVCTVYAFKLATIIAYERLQIYLNDAITAILSDHPEADAGPEPLQWTGSKTGLYEVIYHLYAGKVLNNGNTTLEAIVKYIEKIFGIELNTHTTTFQEILRRKKGANNYWQYLDNQYLLYIEAIDERNRQRNSRRQ